MSRPPGDIRKKKKVTEKLNAAITGYISILF